MADYGIKAGVSLANLTGSDASASAGETKKMLLGFAGGAFVTYQLVPQFAIQPELLFAMKGAKYEAGSITLKEKFNFIEIPVLLKFTPAMQGKIKPAIFAGPFLGLRMTAKETVSGLSGPDTTIFGTDTVIVDNGTTDIKDFVKSTDFGITFGAGLSYAMATKGALTFDVRYDLGLSKIGKAVSGGTAPNIKTSAILLLVGYNFK